MWFWLCVGFWLLLWKLFCICIILLVCVVSIGVFLGRVKLIVLWFFVLVWLKCFWGVWVIWKCLVLNGSW